MKLQKQCRFQGREYAFLSDDSREIDAQTLFVQTKTNALFTPSNTPFIAAKDLPHIFSQIPKIIGITGTNGKTTTAAIIAWLLSSLGHSCALLGTRGMFIGDRQIKPKGLTTPCVLELYADIALASECEFLVMEVSSHAIEQERIAGLSFIAKVLTNITSDHLDYHKTQEEYIRVKNSFFADECLKIINADEKKASYNPLHAFSYSITNPSDLQAKTYTLDSGISAMCLFRQDANHTQEIPIYTKNLYGKHNLYNILAALLCVHKILDINPTKIIPLLKGFSGVRGRMEIVHTNPLIVVDFAHTQDGMLQIFESFKGRNIAVVFGAGGDRDKSKRPKMGACAYQYAQKIYITSDNPRNEEPQSIIDDILEGIPDSAHKAIYTDIDREVAIKKAINELRDDEVLLVLGKGDEIYQIFKDKTNHFDDKEMILKALESKL